MKRTILKYFVLTCAVAVSQSLEGCLFEYIKQPKTARTGEVIDIEISIRDDIVPEPNAHKGILGIIAPDDWTFISATYSSDIGSGILSESEEWKDSVEASFPISQYGDNMKWIVLISDQGYTYEDPVTFVVQLKLQVGQTEGCFNLGYLTTKATSGLLSSGNPQWAPLSFPHPIGVPDSNLCVSLFETHEAPEWDDLFDRTSGWTGADGIYSVPLNGFEQPSNEGNNKQLILFGDTFIGEVDSLGRRVNSQIINNTLAIMQNTEPIENNIEFFWREDSNGNPETVFIPETPTANQGDWYWLMDGISIDDTIYVFALRLNSTGGGAFGFEVNGVALIKFTLNEESFISNVQQFDTPLFFKNESEGWEIILGQAIMPMTVSSGNSSPDGYIYVYGPKDVSSGKELVAARTLPENIGNFDLWEFWNGTGWGNSMEECASITSGISQEFSVTPISSNKYLLVVQSGNNVAAKFGESPVGPFGISYSVYKCPEVKEDPNIFVYNAKAHPNLSTPEKLLISYNVNTFNFSDHFSNANIYRPRFIYLKINDTTTTGAPEFAEAADEFSLEQNYPNPFNPSTTISFYLKESGFVSLWVYDMLGNEVTQIARGNLTAGFHSYTFDADNLNGKTLASGVYLYTLRTEKFNLTKKMVFLK
jgi:hypothetical protein